MTNEQLAMILANYYTAIALLKVDLQNDDLAMANLRAAELKAAINAAIKTLGVDIFVSPLG